ncbi:Uncharacterized protein FWK35_00012468, partial [Aphis craccivora]
TKTNPVVDINGKQICLIYDVPHIIKSLRNNVLNGDIEIGKKKICFQDIKDTFPIDVNSKTACSMPKITTHLYPNTCKSVSASIRICIATGELTSDTAEFVMQINNTFDVLNSKTLYDKNPNSRPLRSLENLFSIMRQKNGYNRNPTSRMFRSCYANICTFSLMKCSELCNCEDDNDVFLTVDVLSDSSNSDLSSYMYAPDETTTLETSSIVYFAGYLKFALLRGEFRAICQTPAVSSLPTGFFVFLHQTSRDGSQEHLQSNSLIFTRWIVHMIIIQGRICLIS